jgi:undecaprenyl diphosphate synthase
MNSNHPSHVAIIMDGNGRWAAARHLPRMMGHQQGVESVRVMIEACLKKQIPYLTLFGFSSENWRRPQAEIDFLFALFLRLLKTEIKALIENGVRLNVVGDYSAFSDSLKEAIVAAQEQSQKADRLTLNIAFNYGGRWDLLEAARKVSQKVSQGLLLPEQITETVFAEHLALGHLPDPDLLIRTSGEYRISNFLLWQLAYSELYFSDVFWPDFRGSQFEAALEAYANRQRRFGNIVPIVLSKTAAQDIKQDVEKVQQGAHY